MKEYIRKKRNNDQGDKRRRSSVKYVTKKKESSFTPINISVGGHLVGVIKISATNRPTAL